jgi:hypothetical protein
MSSSFTRIVTDELDPLTDSEDPDPPESVAVDSGLVWEVGNLVRLARERWHCFCESTIALTFSGAGLSTDERVSRFGELQNILTKHTTSLCDRIITSRPKDAGAVLDLLQEVSTSSCGSEVRSTSRRCHPAQWLDCAPADHPDRRQAIYLLVRLSIGSKRLPRLLYVSNITLIGSRDPWRTGQFSTISRW